MNLDEFGYIPLVETTCGGSIESNHYGSGAISINGEVITKIGAEGYEGISVIPSTCKFFKRCIGIISKINYRDHSFIAGPIMSLAYLESLGLFSGQELADFKKHNSRPIVNHQRTNVGKIRPAAGFLQSLDNILL